MERSELFDLMGELELYGMKAAFDEIMATAVKRQHQPQRVVGDLLKAEINEKQARSIKYQLTIAKLPLAKDLADFQFDGTPINETLVRDLAGGGFLTQQRNAVLVGGTVPEKVTWRSPSPEAASDPAHAVASTMSSISSIVSRPKRERPAGSDCRSSHPHGLCHPRRARLSAVRPVRWTTPVPPRQPALRAHLRHRHHQSRLRGMAKRVRRRQDDHRPARSSDHHCDIVETGNDSWRFLSRTDDQQARSLATALPGALARGLLFRRDSNSKGSLLHADSGRIAY